MNEIGHTHLHSRLDEVTKGRETSGDDIVEKTFHSLVREYIREELDASYRGYYHPKKDDSHNS